MLKNTGEDRIIAVWNRVCLELGCEPGRLEDYEEEYHAYMVYRLRGRAAEIQVKFDRDLADRMEYMKLEDFVRGKLEKRLRNKAEYPELDVWSQGQLLEKDSE